MRKTKILGLSQYLNKAKKEITDFWIGEQTKFLIEYAEEKIVEIGNKIQSYHSANHMDRTGNLLNSLCWGVAYNGKLMASGFFRDEVLHDKGIDKSSEAFVHEFFQDYKYAYPVNGRQLAESFLKRKVQGKGWKVFFAILAPYWGYWETGFKLHGFGGGTKFLKFAVMTQVYDEVKRELKVQPHLTVTDAIRYTRPQVKKRYNRYQEGLLKV